jgi:hypothetical protein
MLDTLIGPFRWSRDLKGIEWGVVECFLSRTHPTLLEEPHAMANDNQLDWSDLAIGLYDRLTGRKAEISYEFDNMHVKIPSGTGPSATYAEWILHGTMKIRTRDLSS